MPNGCSNHSLPLRVECSFLVASEGQRCTAVAAWVLTRCSTASRLRRRPVRVGNSGSWLSISFGEPGREDCLGDACERNGALSTSFPFAADVPAGPDHDIAAVQPDELGYT